MADLDPLEVFTYFHLGFDRDFEYRFRNLHDAGRYFGIDADDLQAFLQLHRMDADTIRHIDFNLSARHSDAQMLDLDGASLDGRQTFAKSAYDEFLRALETTYDAGRQFEDIDWDNPLGVSEPE